MGCVSCTLEMIFWIVVQRDHSSSKCLAGFRISFAERVGTLGDCQFEYVIPRLQIRLCIHPSLLSRLMRFLTSSRLRTASIYRFPSHLPNGNNLQRLPCIKDLSTGKDAS